MEIILGKKRADGTWQESEGLVLAEGPAVQGQPGQSPVESIGGFVLRHRDHPPGGWTHWRERHRPHEEASGWREIA